MNGYMLNILHLFKSLVCPGNRAKVFCQIKETKCIIAENFVHFRRCTKHNGESKENRIVSEMERESLSYTR